jgi:hypothetical protein
MPELTRPAREVNRAGFIFARSTSGYVNHDPATALALDQN